MFDVLFQEYTNSKGEKLHFKDSQFLVFVNRILAFVISGLYLLMKRPPPHNCPLYKFAYCSLSNILSSWCQYEALKFVTFPTQVRISQVFQVLSENSKILWLFEQRLAGFFESSNEKGHSNIVLSPLTGLRKSI